MLTRFSVLAVSAALLLSGCSSSGKDASPSASVNSGSVSAQVSGDYGTEPVVAITPGQPATELGITDVIVGSGDPVPAGATVTAQYAGYGAASGQMFDASWLRGEPATFRSRMLFWDGKRD